MINRNSGKTTVLLVILIIMSLALAGGLFYLFQQEQSSNRLLTDELDEVRAKYSIAESTLKDLKGTIEKKEAQLKVAEDQINNLSAQVKQEQEAKKTAQDELEKVKSDLATEKGLHVKLESDLNAAQAALKKAQTQLADLEGKKNLLESRIGDIEQKSRDEYSDVELGTIVVAPESEASTGTPVSAATRKTAAVTSQRSSTLASEGKVLVVNKEYDFAVINLGSKDGVAMGDVFYVYHNSKYIGDITLEKIHDSMAAAGFASSNIKKRIAEGDRVVKKKTR